MNNYSKKKSNRNKTKMGNDNYLNDEITNLFFEGSNCSISDLNFSFKGLTSKRNEKMIYKSNSMRKNSNLNKLNLSNSASKTYNKIKLKYLPKKIFNVPKKNNVPLIFIKEKKNLSLSLTKSLLLIERGVYEKEKHKFKSEYMVKIIKNMDKYLKTKNNYIEYLSDEKKSLVEKYYSSLKIYNNEFIDFLFDDLMRNIDFFLWKKLIIYISERLNNHYIILEKVLKELSESKEQNIILNKKNNIQKYELNNSSNQIEIMNNVIKENKKSMSERSKSQKIYKNNIENLKKSENLAKLEVYRLKSEIDDLTKLLNKNKVYYQKYLDLKSKLEDNNLYIKELRNYIHEMKIKYNTKITFFDDVKNVFKETINQLNIQNEQNIEQFENSQKKIDRNKAEIEKLSEIIDILKERLSMLNEEMLIWINKYNEEKKEHNITKNSVIYMENIIKKHGLSHIF